MNLISVLVPLTFFQDSVYLVQTVVFRTCLRGTWRCWSKRLMVRCYSDLLMPFMCINDFFFFCHSLKFTEKACSMLMAVDIHIHCHNLLNWVHCCNFLSDEKRRKEDPDQDRSSTKCSIDEWLSRREKKRAALSSGRYLMQDTAQNGDFERLDCFQNVFHSLRWVMGSILNDF